MRVFLDANVLFSAAYRETGSVRAFFLLADAGACELVSSGYAVDEARRNIRAKHPERSADLESLLGRIALCPEPAAIDARCHLLVTGDRTHFGALFGRRLRGTVVMLPVDAIGLLVG